jgi:hypothetical protein
LFGEFRIQIYFEDLRELACKIFWEWNLELGGRKGVRSLVLELPGSDLERRADYANYHG